MDESEALSGLIGIEVGFALVVSPCAGKKGGEHSVGMTSAVLPPCGECACVNVHIFKIKARWLCLKRLRK